jgi:hypothetical protein
MASRPNTRHPKGTLARSTADYFYGNSYIANQQIPNATPAIVTYLYNGSTDGSMLYVWGMSAVLNDSDTQDYLACFRTTFFSGLDFTVDSINPIDPQTPACGAKFYYDFASSGIFDQNLFAISIEQQSAGIFPPGPITVIRPGYALQMVSGTPNTNYWLNIYFASLPGE